MINYPPLFEGLEELANYDTQLALWMHGKEQMSSFSEAICRVFDDSHLTAGMETGYLKEAFSESLCARVRKLSVLISSIPEFEDPLVIINHPKMTEIRKVSRDLLNQFGAEKSTRPPTDVGT